MADERVDLLENISANGNGNDFIWLGGRGNFSVTAVAFDSADVFLQTITPEGVWVNVSNQTSFNANGAGPFALPWTRIRAVVANGLGSQSGIFARAIRIPTERDN